MWTKLKMCGSVVKCLTCNLGVLGLSQAGPSGSVMGVSLGKTPQSPRMNSTGETQERHE